MHISHAVKRLNENYPMHLIAALLHALFSLSKEIVI